MSRYFVAKEPLTTLDDRSTFQAAAPEQFLGADEVEIRVSLTPLRWTDGGEERKRLEACGETCYSQVRVIRVEAKDSRMLFHLVRDLIRNLAHIYLQIDI